jgi:hypothetical protein
MSAAASTRPGLRSAASAKFAAALRSARTAATSSKKKTKRAARAEGAPPKDTPSREPSPDTRLPSADLHRASANAAAAAAAATASAEAAAAAAAASGTNGSATQKRGGAPAQDAETGPSTAHADPFEADPAGTASMLRNLLRVVLLQQQQAPIPSPGLTAAASSRRELRFPGIAAFGGESGDPLESWIAQISLRHDLYVAQDDVPESKFVANAATTLADAAVVWWQSLEKDSRPATWRAMKEAIRTQFQPVTSAEQAREALVELKQTKSQSVIQYASEFRRLLARAGKDEFSERFLIERFTKGLYDKSVQRDLRRIAASHSSVAESIALATRVDGCAPPAGREQDTESCAAAAASPSSATGLEARVAELEALLRTFQSRSGTSDNNFGRSHREGDRGGRVPGLSGDEAHRRMTTGRCLWCARTEHRARECPDRAQSKPPTLTPTV